MPVTHPDDMLAELVPEHESVDSLSSAMLRAEADLHVFDAATPGLFWGGRPAYHAAAWTYALACARGETGGPPILVGPLPPGLASEVAPDRAMLQVDGLGRVHVANPTTLLSWTQDGVGHVLEGGRWRAALADYYFWWAHRLHSYHHELSKNRWDLFLAGAAARVGIREIARLGRTVSHLDIHLGQTSGSEDLRWP